MCDIEVKTIKSEKPSNAFEKNKKINNITRSQISTNHIQRKHERASCYAFVFFFFVFFPLNCANAITNSLAKRKKNITQF